MEINFMDFLLFSINMLCIKNFAVNFFGSFNVCRPERILSKYDLLVAPSEQVPQTSKSSFSHQNHHSLWASYWFHHHKNDDNEIVEDKDYSSTNAMRGLIATHWNGAQMDCMACSLQIPNAPRDVCHRQNWRFLEKVWRGWGVISEKRCNEGF